jgi:hypothetical protein
MSKPIVVTHTVQNQTITAVAYPLTDGDGSLVIGDQDGTLITLNLRRLPALLAALQEVSIQINTEEKL